MRKIYLQYNFLVLVVAVGLSNAYPTPQNQANSDRTSFNLLPTKEDVRNRRQEIANSTTPRPRKNRPPGIFRLASELKTETRDDVRGAYNEIVSLFSSQFSPPNATKNGTEGTSNSTPPPSSDDEEPFTITRQEVLNILSSNIRGIFKLFRKELKIALDDSNKYAKEFGRDLGNALVPYFR